MPDLPRAVLQGAVPVDLDADDIAGFEEARRIEPDADTRRGPGRDDVAGAQRHPGGDRGDDRRNVEDQESRVRALPDVAIDKAADAGIGKVDLVAGYRPRS